MDQHEIITTLNNKNTYYCSTSRYIVRPYTNGDVINDSFQGKRKKVIVIIIKINIAKMSDWHLLQIFKTW